MKSRLLVITLFVFSLTFINVPPTDALGPLFPPTSFEELVGNSTLIVTAKVQSTSKQEGWPTFTRRTTVEVLKILKGDPTTKKITIYHEVDYPTVEVSLAEGHTYLLFLYRRQNESFFRYMPPPYWASWEVAGDQLFNRRVLIDKVWQVPLASFLAAINSEVHRASKPVQTNFVGIKVGTNLEQATRSGGFRFIRYSTTYDPDTNWSRYYVLPRNRQEHLVTLDLYKGRILNLNVYFLRDSGDFPDKLLRSLELKNGGLPLGSFGDLNFDLGRMWSDDNAEVRLESIHFGKANGYPWGEFSAYEISITDEHVFHEYLSDNLKRSNAK